MKIKRGSTSVRRLIFIADTSKTDGSGLANLVYNSSGLVAYYYAGDLNNEVQITLATATLGTWTSGGFIAVDNTNMPGWYEIGIPDAALDGGNEVAIQFRGATNMAVVNLLIAIDAVDYQTAAFGALQPTTAGRTLDVTATGAAGIDWGNVENPTTTLNLSGTTISTSQAVASVSGSVGSVTAGVTVTTNNDKTGYTLTVTPPTAATIADAVWDEQLSGHLTAGSTGKTLDIIKKANLTIGGTVAASPAPTTTTFNLTGADYPTGAMEHSVLFFEEGTANIELENSPILTWTNNGDGTVTVVLEEPLTAAPQAGDVALILPQSHVHSVAAIQAGLATAANQTVLIDGMGFVHSVLMGSISDAGTAAETYQISFGGSTYTVDYSGLDATGNRSTTTRTKT